MEEERISRAVARIEAAARRIEAAADKGTPPTDPDIVERHRKLRKEASAALSEIDGLIEGLER